MSYSLDLGSSSLAITTGWQGHGSNPVVVGSTPDSTEEELFVLCHEIKNILVRLIFTLKFIILKINILSFLNLKLSFSYHESPATKSSKTTW